MYSSKSAASNPATDNILFLEVRPAFTSIELLGTLNNLERNLTSSSFAAPSTGAAFNLTFNTPSE
jgi:hypothetical protein